MRPVRAISTIPNLAITFCMAAHCMQCRASSRHHQNYQVTFATVSRVHGWVTGPPDPWSTSSLKLCWLPPLPLPLLPLQHPTTCHPCCSSCSPTDGAQPPLQSTSAHGTWTHGCCSH
jgi:hypothetical protein